jgi:hypothetical protein
MNVYDEIKSWLEYIKTHKDKTNKAEYLIRILETVLADREKLIKENKKIEEARNWYFEHTVNKAVTPEMLHKILRQDYIPKSVIKEKIEELESDNSKFENYTFEKLTSRDIRRTIITNLQELLEKEG